MRPGDRTHLTIEKKSPAPLYAVHADDEDRDSPGRLGPDSEQDQERIIDRQTDEFKRFLAEINRQHAVKEELPTKSQVVLDSFEQLRKQGGRRGDSDRDGAWKPLQENAIEVASQAISQLLRQDFELEIVVWAASPQFNVAETSDGDGNGHSGTDRNRFLHPQKPASENQFFGQTMAVRGRQTPESLFHPFAAGSGVGGLIQGVG